MGKDSLKELELKMLQDVDKLVKMLGGKVLSESTTAKNPAIKMMNELVKGLDKKMELKELEQLQKNVKTIITEKKKDEAEATKQKQIEKKKAEDEAKKKYKEEQKKKLGDEYVNDEDFFADFM